MVVFKIELPISKLVKNLRPHFPWQLPFIRFHEVDNLRFGLIVGDVVQLIIYLDHVDVKLEIGRVFVIGLLDLSL